MQLDPEHLARAVSAVTGISVDLARAAVRDLEAARHRQRAIAAGLERYPPPLVRVCSEDAATGRDLTGDSKPCQRCGWMLPARRAGCQRTGLSPWRKGCMRDYRQQRKGSPLREVRSRLTDEQREQVLALLVEGGSTAQVTADTGVSSGSVSRIRQGL
jgi:hypothetical protein